jgi:GNAT superfamily N-acetyltransferase
LRHGILAERFFFAERFVCGTVLLRNVFLCAERFFVRHVCVAERFLFADTVLRKGVLAKRNVFEERCCCGTGLSQNVVLLRNGFVAERFFAERVFRGTGFAERVSRNVFFVAERVRVRLASEVKRITARLVLGWGTAWGDLRVLPACH